MQLVGFYYKNISRPTALWLSNGYTNKRIQRYRDTRTEVRIWLLFAKLLAPPPVQSPVSDTGFMWYNMLCYLTTFYSAHICTESCTLWVITPPVVAIS